MGFWDVEIDGLVALGIDLSPGQVRLLEEGGEGLALRVLPDPLHFQCCESPYLDVNEDLALYACPITVYAPDDPLPYGGETPVQIAESYWDEEWRTWPTVLGTLSDPGEGLWGGAEMVPVRAWSVLEADDGMQDRFSRAGRVWLSSTDYEPLAFVNEEFASGVDCGEQPCRENCKDQGDPEHECLSEDDVENVEFWRAIWDLQDKGYLDQADPLRLVQTPPVPPFETVLTGEDLAVYARLKRRSKQSALNALAGIRRDQRPVYMRHEGAFEPWY